MQIMMERQHEKKLAGRTELDDACVGGEMPDKRGRGSWRKPLSWPPLRRRSMAGR